MAPSVKIVDGIDSSSGTSFEAALGMLETSIRICKSKVKHDRSSKKSANKLSSKSTQQIKRTDSKSGSSKDKKIQEECFHKRESGLKKKPYKSEHEEKNSNQTGHKKRDKTVKSNSEDGKNKFNKELGDRNKDYSEKKKSHKNRQSSLEKHASSDYKKQNKCVKQSSLKNKDDRKRHMEPSVDKEAKKRKLDQTEASKSHADTSDNNYHPYSSGKIDFERLVESGTVSLSDAMDMLLNSVPEIADVSVHNQRRQSIQGLKTSNRVNAAKLNQNRLYASGQKSTKVPSLVNICTAYLQDNLSLIGFTGGAQYSVMRPVLQKATPGELYRIEFNNQYLIDGQTDELWEVHCKRDLPYRKKLWWESYRDMYIHYEMERLTKLGVLPGNTKKQVC